MSACGRKGRAIRQRMYVYSAPLWLYVVFMPRSWTFLHTAWQKWKPHPLMLALGKVCLMAFQAPIKKLFILSYNYNVWHIILKMFSSQFNLTVSMWQKRKNQLLFLNFCLPSWNMIFRFIQLSVFEQYDLGLNINLYELTFNFKRHFGTSFCHHFIVISGT